MRRMIRANLVKLARLHPSNKRDDGRQAYPQTWWLVPGRKNRKGLLYRCIGGLCGFITGHELSVTEKGYGGGAYMDCNCRWCDKGFRVPLAECSTSPMLADLIDRMRRDDLEGNGYNLQQPHGVK